jgi:hypothetical protein
MIVGLKLAKDIMIANEDINTVLVAAGYRNCDLINYQNQRTRFMFNLAAGGCGGSSQKKPSQKPHIRCCLHVGAPHLVWHGDVAFF